MKNYLSLLLLALPLFASASTYTLDLSSATPGDASAPVLRHSSLPLDGLSNVRPALQVGDTIHLTLFPDTSFALEIVSAPPPGIAGQSFIARDPSSGASAVVKVTKSGIRIAIDNFMRSLQYTVRCKDGLIDIFERDNSQVDPGECGTCQGSVDTPIIEPAETTSSTPAARRPLGTSGNAFPAASQKSVVDILVAFDQGAVAKSSELGYDTIEDFADYAVNKMNMVLEKSQLLDTFSYRLAGVTEIDDTYTSIGNSLLGNLRTRAGALAKLTQLREKYGADTITLLVDKTEGNTTGIGYGYYPISSFPGPASFDGMNYACNVCDIKTVYSRYTMSHETGHNMGCDHSNRQGDNSGPGRFSDSCGYHFTDATDVRRYTIMGYNYTADDNYNYSPVPYFSSPDIVPEEYGCALGLAGVNNNRGTLLQTHAEIASLREHVMPYDWDVKFLDNNGKEIPDGAYFYLSCDVTLTNSNPNAEIYYTQDGSTPTSESDHCKPGYTININLYSPKTLTACAVTNGVAISTRSITLRDGLTWSGDENGNGVWTNTDSSEKPWSGNYFYNDPVLFSDLSGISSATVTVKGAVAPSSVSFSAINTAYTFDKGDDAAQITIPDANFAPTGDLTFNVPVQLSATTFTNMTGCALTFNAPFGQTIDAASGDCTNLVTISPYGTMTVAPGAGKTQSFNTLNNQNGGFSGNSTFRVGEGTVVFNGAINSGAGVTGRTKLEVGNGGSLIFNQGGATGYDMNGTSLTIEKGGSVTFNQMEHMKRTVHLDGGTIYAKRFDLMSNPGVYVADDSAIENNGGGYILIRGFDSEINVSAGKTLTLNVGTQTDGRSDTTGRGIVKKGGGTIVANNELKHSGVTDIEGGTIEVGYSSGSTVYGQGWIVASNSTLRVKSGCTLKVPSLTLDETATISLPAASSAPLIVNGNVDLTEVKLAIQECSDLSLGVSYPLISSTGEISGLKDFIRQDWPRPADGLGWKVAVSGGVLTASIVDIADADPYIDFTTNISGLRPTIPEDSTMSSAGGLQIGSSPIVIDGLDTKAVSIAVRFVVPETSPSDFATICSLRLGSNRINCMRNSSGELLGYYNDTTLTANSTSTVQLTTGEHLLQVGYYSESTAKGGTKMFLDGKVVYEATGLKFSSDSVSRVVFGATSGDTPIKPYTGLVIKEVAVLDVKSSLPPPHMTASGGDVSYELNVPDTRPRIFPLTPDGSVEMYETMLSASFSGTYEKLSVSVVAAFPAGATGTIFSVPLRPDDSYSKYATQVEYRGDGVLAFRDDGGSSLTTTCNVSADMTVPHLYTMTYTMGAGFKLYMDGEEVMSNTAYFQGKSLFIWERVVFGCGYWTNWMTSYDDNPNPISNLKVYASHIALGTDDQTVSETQVKEATGYDSEEPEHPEEPEEPTEPDPEPPATPAVVDVLVAYDNGAYNYVTSRSRTLEEFAQTQIERMNEVLVTNKLDRFYSYRLAGVCRVNEGYSDINNVATLVAEGEGPCASLRAAREMCGADTVTLLVNTSGITLGNSLQIDYRDDVPGQHDCAYSVCSIAWVDSNEQYTMLHENAHTMGCGHARAQYTEDDLALNPDKYSYGYYFTDANSVNRHTIMAYGNNASPYFSTTSSEFGYKLGDSTNNNARVLKETCADVSQWRNTVKPFDNEAIVTVDDTGEEVVTGRMFANKISIRLASPIEGAEIYYSLNGTDPTYEEVENVNESEYVYPYTSAYPVINITSTRTLSVVLKPAGADYLLPVRKVKFVRCDLLADASDATWYTSLKFPWTTDDDTDTVRSCNHTDYSAKNKKCTTPLSATIEGPKVLSFKHKSYFFGSDLGSNYSHFEVLLDDSIVLSANNCNREWSDDVKVSIPAGKHTVQFVYSQRNAMNNSSDYKEGNPKANDAVWLKDIALSDPEELETTEPCDTFFEWTPGSAPTGWFTEWGGEDQGGTHNVVAPDGSWQDMYVTYYDGDSNSQKWIPWKSNANPESLDNYTFMVYGKIDAVNPSTGKLAVLWDMGFIGKQKTILAKDAAGNVKLIQANGNTIKRCINAGQVEGYHLFTVRFSTTSGASLQIDDGVIYSDSTFTQVSDKGLQIGSILGGFDNSPFEKGLGFVVVKMQAFATDSIPASQFTELYETYAAMTNRVMATDAVLRISEIMPKPTDDLEPGLREGMDVNGLESGWVEVENTSADKWADLADYRFIRTNRGKKTNIEEPGNLPSRLVPPHSRTIFYTSERYPNSDTPEESAFQNVVAEDDRVKPVRYPEYGNIIVYGKKVNPKKSPFVRLYYMPDKATTNIVDTVIIPSDVPEGYSIIVGKTVEGQATQRWLCPTPTRGTENSATDGLTKLGPNVGPLYENKETKKGKVTIGTKHEDSPNEFAKPVPPATPGEDYEISFALNPVMSPTVANGFRDEDAITSITLKYRRDLDDSTINTVPVELSTDSYDAKDWGHVYKVSIPADDLPAAGHLVQWKFEIADASGNNWTSPSFNNKDDGYEWYGTIVEPDKDTQMSATLPTWHMFASGNHLTQMDVDKDAQNKSLVPNYARIAIYDSSTSNYYDYVRIDLRGNTSAGFTKKGHGLRFAKAHPLTMTDIVSGKEIEGIRKTSLISEYADPSYMRQMIAFWLWNKMGNKVPFDFPVRCNLNGAFYQLAFNSERFTDELIEDVYKLDKYGYSYKNVGTLNEVDTTAGKIEKKTPDDENEADTSVLEAGLINPLINHGAANSHSSGESAALTKFVVEKFNLPAWINYLASARITQEMDDVWANVCAYYDNAEMKEGVRGTDTWMPLGYDFNLSFGQFYINDLTGNPLNGLSATNDWFKSHPLYGGWTVRASKNEGGTLMRGNNGFEAIYQSPKFRRLYLRRLRTLMDQELKEPGTAEEYTPFMSKMREMADLMRADAALDKARWSNDDTDNAIDVWKNITRPASMDAGIDEIWSDYVVPRRKHLYVTHSITNTAKTIGYGSSLNAGIPEAQSPMDVLAPKIVLDLSGKDLGYIAVSNLNDEVVDMSGWKLKFGVEWTLPPGTVCDANDCIYIVRDRRAFITNPPVDLTDQVIIGNASFDDIIANVFLNSADNEPLKGLSSEEGAVVFDAKNQAAADEAVADIAPTLTQKQQNDGLDVQYLKVEAQPTATKGKYQAVVVLNPETVAPPAVKTDMSEPVEIEDDTTDPDQKTVSITVSNAIKGLWYGYAVTDDLSTAFVDDTSSFQQADDNPSLRITGSSRDKSKESEFFLIKVMLTQPPTE